MIAGNRPLARAAAVSAAALAAAAALGLSGSGAAAAAPHDRGGPKPPDRTTSAGHPVDLGALFIGAHPDDEAGQLSTYGEWGEKYGLRTGVITVTRGEGGGNAVGPEEGPALGLLREKEERAAVGTAGIRDVFNLDKVDFYYTVSEPLTRQIWGHEDTLGKVVRIIRQTRPEILSTMNPAPSPGNHGNHQEAGRLAIEAFNAAADPKQYPEQITKEGLKPWAPLRLLVRGSAATSPNGPACATGFTLKDTTQNVYGVWSGERAKSGRTWAAIERDAQRLYRSQGWATFPDVSSDPNALGCDYFQQVDSRVPFPAPGSAAAGQPSASLDGAVTHAPGTVPLGTLMRVATTKFGVLAGAPFTATVEVTAPRKGLRDVVVVPSVPSGWKVEGRGDIGTLQAGRTVTKAFTVTPAAGATVGDRARVAATLRSDEGSGYSDRPVQVVAPVAGSQQLLPQVADFEKWTGAGAGQPQLSGTVSPVLTLASGGSRQVRVDLRNSAASAQSGTVALDLPAGFTAQPAAAAYGPIAAGGTGSATFTVTNTDTSLKTSNEGGTPGAPAGDYAYTITTTSPAGTSKASAALELVPRTTIGHAAAAPKVDGVDTAGEYPGPAIDISRLWEGTACTSAADCSATAKLAWRDDTLYVLVDVTDDTLGTKLDAADCKRHWRTDSVELAIDPRGTSENTSTTFKAAILPVTAQGGPCYERDADNHQGPGAETAPGMKVASKVGSGGYTVETSIPMSLLPGAVDPEHLGLNLFVYDSDTQDLTGKTRIGWSTWGGVQGDPYRWGQAKVEGYTPPAGRPTTAPEPVIPLSALSSLDSPPSLTQAVAIDVPLAGGPASTRANSGWVDKARLHGDTALVRLRANAPGTAHVHVVDSAGTVGSRTVTVTAGKHEYGVVLDRAPKGPVTVLVGWEDAAGGTLASKATAR
ncbi:sugar-binding protein [Pedococcus sp. KACC 23699]|uniref:Sugar-binding protein n=1 Tax=Pedococcus sp. KACC 23699 TaxID=3149228 RepID=A0AAU7JP43_9MICO